MRNNNFKFWSLIAVLGVVTIVALGSKATIAKFQLEASGIGYLERAANANTIDIAKKQLDLAIEDFGKRGLTKGDTGILWTTPATDIKFWFDNIIATRAELDKVTPTTTQLEQTNILMKLRETIMEHQQNSDRVTQPVNLAIYPSQKFYFYVMMLSVIVVVVSLIGMFINIE